MIYTLVVPLKRIHLVTACGNFRSGCFPKNMAAPFLATPLSVNSSKFSNICLLAVDGLSFASVRKSFYKSNNGTIPIERSSIMDAYREESIYTEGRNKNLSKNIDNLIQQSYISAITKTKFIITSAGIEQIQLIATGKSEAKLRKPRNTKRKSPNNDK